MLYYLIADNTHAKLSRGGENRDFWENRRWKSDWFSISRPQLRAIEASATVSSTITPGDLHSERRGPLNERTHRHSPYYTPDYCIAWSIDLCLFKPYRLLYFVVCTWFSYSWEKKDLRSRRAPHRVAVPRTGGSFDFRQSSFLSPPPPPPLIAFFPENDATGDATDGANTSIRSCKLSLYCIYIQRPFVSFILCTLYVVCVR